VLGLAALVAVAGRLHRSSAEARPVHGAAGGEDRLRLKVSIHRYPLMSGEYGSLAGEFVIDEAHPKPSAVPTDGRAIYWATADEEAGEGAIWMVCESAL
jgi:hypothetical protein